MKVCVICKKKKPITAFYKNKGNYDEYSNKCKQCQENIRLKEEIN